MTVELSEGVVYLVVGPAISWRSWVWLVSEVTGWRVQDRPIWSPKQKVLLLCISRRQVDSMDLHMTHADNRIRLTFSCLLDNTVIHPFVLVEIA